MNPKRIIAFGLISIGSIDLMFGNTDHALLPDMFTNVLTQQIDLLLIGVGIFMIWKL